MHWIWFRRAVSYSGGAVTPCMCFCLCSIPVPNMVSRGVDRWRSKGLQVSVQPLQYNAEVDAADASADYAMLQQQMFALQRGQSGRKLLLQ